MWGNDDAEGIYIRGGWWKKYSISLGKVRGELICGLEVMKRFIVRDSVVRVEGRNMVEFMSVSLGDYVWVYIFDSLEVFSLYFFGSIVLISRDLEY